VEERTSTVAQTIKRSDEFGVRNIWCCFLSGGNITTSVALQGLRSICVIYKAASRRERHVSWSDTFSTKHAVFTQIFKENNKSFDGSQWRLLDINAATFQSRKDKDNKQETRKPVTRNNKPETRTKT